jgi:hypothetical protein
LCEVPRTTSTEILSPGIFDAITSTFRFVD